MRPQPKPFTVEIRPSRKLKPIDRKPGSGANWTSRLILTRSPRPSLNRCRPLARPTTDTDGPQAASRSPAVSGCRECRKLTARCACAAAWKIARLSSLRTLSQESRYEA